MDRTVVIIPALNEEKSIGKVLYDIPDRFCKHIIVADNGSTDKTREIALQHGARVVQASPRGYGAACLSAIARAKKLNPSIYVFLDGDYSDFPADMTAIVNSLTTRKLDLVIGSRTLGLAEKGALLPQARFGNWLATSLIALRFGYRFTDLGPFRAIRAEALDQLEMKDKDFGWTIEMQVKALKLGLKVGEVPVRYRRRIGKSKITGTVKGTISAGAKILWVLGRHCFLA